MFFGSARQAFLAFLSRLTPQVLFLTLAIIFASKLDLTKFDWTFHGLKNVMPLALCVMTLLGAAVASTTLFIDEALTSSQKYDRYAVFLNKKHISECMRIRLIFRGIWKYNKLMLVQASLIMIIMEVGFLAIVVIAVQGAMASPLLKLHG